MTRPSNKLSKQENRMTRPSNKLSKQLTKGADGMGNNKKRQEAILAIGQLTEVFVQLEKGHNALAQITQNAIKSIEDRLENSSIVVQAILQTLGEITGTAGINEKVAENSKKIRIKLLEDESTQQGEAVAKALTEGTLVKEETVKDNTLVVTSIKKADGSPIYPTKNYTPFAYLKPEIQAVVRDKKEDDVVELPTEGGGTMQVIGIYSEVKKEEAPKTQTQETKNE